MSDHHSHAMTLTELRLALLKGGYDPIPLRGKNPGMMEKWAWQKIGHASVEQAINWSLAFSDATNTGVLCRRTPFLDIDILNPDAARDVEELVRERYEDGGYILPRIGKSPKRALPFRTDEPFAKISMSLIAPNGDTSQKIEFLCDGQQCVVDGIHPETRKPYSWPSKSLLDVPREELPYIRGLEAQQLVDDIVELLISKHGYQRKDDKKPREEKIANGHADWDGFLDNLIDHDRLAEYAMSLLRAGMSDGAAVNFLRAQVERLDGVDPDRKQRRLNEIPGMVSSARDKLEEPGLERRLPYVDLSLDLKVRDWTVYERIPNRNVTLLTGEGAIGKSLLAMQLSGAVVLSGAEWIGIE